MSSYEHSTGLAAGLERFPLRAESYGCTATELWCEAQPFGRRARTARAARAAGALGLGAVLSLPIPGWHFVGVPGLALAAVWVGRRRLRQQRAICAVTGPCPACGAEQRFEVPAAAEWPHTASCPGCRAFVKLAAAD